MIDTVMFTHKGRIKSFLLWRFLIRFELHKLLNLLLFWKKWYLMRAVTSLATHTTLNIFTYAPTVNTFWNTNSHYVKIHKGLLKCIILCLPGTQSLWEAFRKCFSVWHFWIKESYSFISFKFQEVPKCRDQQYIRKWWGQHCSDVSNVIFVPPGNRKITLISWLTPQK